MSASPMSAGPPVDAELAVALEDAQRRGDVRVQAVRPLRLDAGSGPAITHTQNVSGGGLLLAATAGLGAGDRVAFRLDLGEEHPTVTGEGTVVRETGDGQLALRIDGMEPRERDLLVRFVFERQRLDRKHGRRP